MDKELKIPFTSHFHQPLITVTLITLIPNLTLSNDISSLRKHLH